MSNKKQKENNKEKNELLNIIVIVITAVVIVSLICATIIITKFQSKPTEAPTAPQDGTNVPATPQEMIKTYEASESGTAVSETESKTWAYFTSHYQDDYYRVNEIAYSIVQEGAYTEYYETETVAYSKQGYLYNKKTDSSYEEQEFANSVVQLYTPEKSYIIYPDMKSYFAGEQTTQNYKNNIDFPVDRFETGTININGFEYYYEQYTDTSGITYKYCFDKNDDLRYRISSSSTGTITERYIEYSKDVDYSLFEIPSDYKLVE